MLKSSEPDDAIQVAAAFGVHVEEVLRISVEIQRPERGEIDVVLERALECSIGCRGGHVATNRTSRLSAHSHRAFVYSKLLRIR